MAEPVTLAEARAQVNIIDPADTTFDDFLTSLIAPARAYVERCSRYFWVAATRTETFPAWGDYLEIWRRPIASINSVTYGLDDTGFTDYLAPVGRFPLRVYPSDSFPELADGEIVTVEYTSGALDPTSEEYLIGKRAMLLLIGHWFENRETVVIGQTSAEVHFAVTELLNDLRPVSAY